MLTLRLACSRIKSRATIRLATTAAPTVTRTSSSSSQTVVPLANVEAHWERLTQDEQLTIHRQLEELQKRDWKQLTLDEKKAAYYIAFGPHGPRAPIKPPGSNVKIFFGVAAAIGVAAALYGLIRSQAPPPPRTMTREWQEAMNEKARERGINPITGVSSEGYSGKGFVSSSK